MDTLDLGRAGVHAELIHVGPGRTIEAAIREYEQSPLVLYAEPNGSNPLAATIPNDFQFANEWGLHNTGQTVNGQTGVADADIDAPEAWDRQTGSSSVVVGVADTGVQYDHPDLAPQIWSNPGETGGGKETNNVDDDSNGYVDDWRGWDWVYPAVDGVAGSGDNDPRDQDGHGTHVAGTIGAKGNDNYGVAGVNWNVKLMPLRICGAEGDPTVPNASTGCQFWSQAKAFAYAGGEGAAVVNASLGGGASSTTVSNAILNAPNTLFVVAAGNESNNNDVSARYPCQYPRDNIVCVAASTMSDGLSSFSNWGATSVDLAAPGSNILSDYLPGPFYDAFNFNANSWTFSGTNNTWGWVDFPAPAGGFLADSPAGPYQNNTDSYARVTNPLNLTARTGCRLNYFMRLDTELNFDYVQPEVSTDGTNWTALPGWWGSTGGNWQPVEQSLSAYDGQSSLHLRFHMHSDVSVTGQGADLDDVIIQCTTSPSNQGLAFLQGTSMATPHVAGAAALLKAAVASATPAQVKQALLGGVDTKPAFTGITVTGGRLNLNTSLGLILPPTPPGIPVADFDGDGDTDISVWRPSNGTWYAFGGLTQQWGISSDVPVPGQYDGDPATDVAAWRPSNGTWYVQGGATQQWGISTDVPVPGQYDADPQTEFAVWRPSNGTWYVFGGATQQWGISSDIPVPGDYDGDGDTDIAVWRPSNGTWYVHDGATQQWGSSTDVPVPGQYDTDPATEFAVWRPSNGTWYVFGGATQQWGISTDVPVAGDYDGDGDSEFAAWRPANGTWYVHGGATQQWGVSSDKPLPPLPSVSRLLFP